MPGVIVLFLALKYLTIWSAFSGLALGTSVFISWRLSQLAGNAPLQPHAVIASACIFALQIFGVGLAALLLGTLLAKQIADVPT